MTPDFKKDLNGLLPAIIQDFDTGKVLMLGFMNDESFAKTKETNKVTFFSRSKNRLWTKGEESGNFLEVIDIKLDCDNDTFLIKAKPVEEAVEVVIEAKDKNDDLFKNESADLLFHLLVLFAEKNISLNDVIDVLKKRHQVK